MVDRTSNYTGSFETTLSLAMGATDTTASVVTTAGAPTSPCYMVIDPEDDAKREIIFFDGTFTGTSFVTTDLANRFLDGSAAGSGLSHASGAVVRFSPVGQMFEDLHDRVDADAADLTTHAAAADPHTGYVLESLVDAAGDLLVGSADNTLARLAKGTAEQVLRVNAAGTGLEYATPSSATSPVWLNPGDFEVVSGSPARGVIGTRWVAWLLDAAAEEVVGATWDMPSGWATVNVDLYWTNPGAGSGDVKWTVSIDNAADGGDLAATGPNADTTAAAPGIALLEITRLLTGQALTADNLMNLRLIRRAADAADTFTNDAAVLGVLITKAS